MRILFIVGAVVALIAGIVGFGHLSGSPDKWIGEHYTKTASHAYHSSKPPSRVIGEITGKFHPISRVNDATGTYLEYQKSVVAVLPSGTGADITVDTPTTGYHRYISHVGNYWQRPGAGGWNRQGGADFRDGGPGSGK